MIASSRRYSHSKCRERKQCNQSPFVSKRPLLWQYNIVIDFLATLHLAQQRLPLVDSHALFRDFGQSLPASPGVGHVAGRGLIYGKRDWPVSHEKHGGTNQNKKLAAKFLSTPCTPCIIATIGRRVKPPEEICRGSTSKLRSLGDILTRREQGSSSLDSRALAFRLLLSSPSLPICSRP